MRKLWLILLVCHLASAQERINWYGTWEAGLKQATATRRPILLVAAAPQCHGVSGLW